MGDPKKPKKKYTTPVHPWQKFRIEEEKVLIKEYGLKNKKEIWKMTSMVRSFARQAKNLIARTSDQGKKEKDQLILRLNRLGLLSKEADLDDVLGLDVKDLMERRLQTMVFKRGLAKSVKQARQFIIHEHIMINGKKMTVPSYLVKMGEEETIAFAPNSELNDPMHPEREQDTKMAKKPEEPKQKKVEEKK